MNELEKGEDTFGETHALVIRSPELRATILENFKL